MYYLTTNIQIVITTPELFEPFRNEIFRRIVELNYSWSKQVQLRLEGCIDLVAAEVVYHKSCHSRFCTNKDLASPVRTAKCVS